MSWRTTAAVAVAALVLAATSRAAVRPDGHHQRPRLRVHGRGARRARLRGGGWPARGARRRPPAPGLLSEVGDLLASAETPRRRCAAVAAAAVPAVADRCTIDLTGPGGAPSAPRRSRARPPPAVEQALARVARGAPPEASRSELVVPLAARDGRLGALELGMNGSRRRFGAEDRALAEELARRCAAALDNAKLVAEARPPRASCTMPTACSTRSSSARRSGSRCTTATCATSASTTAWRRSTGCRRRAPRAHGRRGRPRGRSVEADLRRVLETGEPLTELEVAGATAAAPGVDREWVVSYWPVRRRGDRRVVGVGAVVFEVTARRAAERAVREQTCALRVAAARPVGRRRGDGRPRRGGRA